MKKKVAVIGGGPAGITAADVLLKRGHSVDLYEKNSNLGGSVLPGSVPEIKYEFRNYLNWLNYRVDAMKDNKQFQLFLNKKVTAKELKEHDYDVIVTASGARQVKPPVPGIEGDNVYFGVDVLKNPDSIDSARNIVVIGGGVVGAEIAYYFTYEKNKKVKVVEMDSYIMNHACTANRGYIIHYLEQAGVELMNQTTLKEVRKGRVIVEQNIHKNVPNPYVTWSPILPENIENPLDALHPNGKELIIKELEADAVILSTGNKSRRELYTECVAEHAADEIYNVGDSFKSGRVFEAVRAAYRKAIQI